MEPEPFSGEAAYRATLARLRDASGDDATRILRELRAVVNRVVNHDGYGDVGLETNVVGWLLDAGTPRSVAHAIRAHAGDEDVQVEAARLVSDLARAMGEPSRGIERDTDDDDELLPSDPDEDPPLDAHSNDDDDPIGDAYFDVGYATRVAECARILAATSPVRREGEGRGRRGGADADGGPRFGDQSPPDQSPPDQSPPTRRPPRDDADVDVLAASLGTLAFFRDIGGDVGVCSERATRAMLRAATVEEFNRAGVVVALEGDADPFVRVVLGGEVGCHARPGDEDASNIRAWDPPPSPTRRLLDAEAGDGRSGGDWSGGDWSPASEYPVSEYPVSEYPSVSSSGGGRSPNAARQTTIEATFGPRRECDFGGNGGGGPGGVLRTGRWFGPRDPVVASDGPSACRHVATYVTRTNRVAILSIPSEVCRACLVENAVEGSLANFFGDVGASDEEEEEKEEKDDETLGAPGVAWDVDESPSDASERARRADALDPANTFFVETGLTDALLHVTMGSHPLSHRVQIAALGAIRTIASEPCGEGTRRRLGAAGALDRVAAAATAAEFYGGEDTAAAVREEAKTCLRALTTGCEQNMRAALALGCERMVW